MRVPFIFLCATLLHLLRGGVERHVCVIAATSGLVVPGDVQDGGHRRRPIVGVVGHFQ